MTPTLEDSFVVFVRVPNNSPRRPDGVERELLRCGSYEEARRAQRQFTAPGRPCVIRFVGPTGGGD